MREALDRFLIRGVAHNISFLSALMVNPRFVAGKMNTNMIGDEYPDGFQPTDLSHRDPTIFISVAASMMRGYRDRAAQIEGQLDGHERHVPNDWIVVMNNEQYPVSVIPVEGGYDVKYNNHTHVVRSKWEFGQPIFSGTIDGRQVFIQVLRESQTYRLLHDGSQVDVQIVTPRVAEFLKYMPEKPEPDLSNFLLSPMPGLLVSLAVKEGDVINAGQELAVLEAMKMENTLLAERDGVVARIHYEPGANLAVDEIIMEFEQE
jgi:propionyl-CoA carboxylase alpha chain